jgi:methyl-accepting chemotaxis protein
MKWNVGMKIGAGFGIALAILVVIGAVSYRSTVKLTETAQWVAHTHEVLERLESVLSGMKDAETGQRGYLLTGEERYLEPFRAAREAMSQKFLTLRELTKDNLNQQRRLDVLRPLLDAKLSELQETIDARKGPKGFDAALQIVISDRGKKVMDEIRRTIDEMAGEENNLLKKRSEEAGASAQSAMATIVFGTIAAFVVLTLVGLAITRNIGRPLRALTVVAERITVGDLSASLPADSRRDELGVLARAFERMTQSLRSMASVAEQIAVGDLRAGVKPQSAQDVLGTAFERMVENLRDQIRELIEGANVLGAASSEIVASTSQLAATATQSAAAVNETITTVEEVRQTAMVSSQKAKLISESAQKAVQVSQGGRKSAEDVVAGMSRIRQQMEAIAASMVRLSEQSQAIGQIIATVEDLSVQSNLLAVNAAIEAAKAGEHGKGFGVVAQEVKSLALQSRQATSQVRTILGDIQKATGAAVMATEEGGKAVEAGTRQTEVAGSAIQSLAASANEAAQATTQIAVSSQQQLVGVDQVAGAMESITQVSAQNVASARQMEVAMRNLDELGRRLKQMVERYKL